MAWSMFTADSDYEFNAPQYIDFLNNPESEDVDNWFDENPGDEGGIRISQIDPLFFFEHHSNFKKATMAITAALEDKSPDSTTTSTTENGKVEAEPEEDVIEPVLVVGLDKDIVKLKDGDTDSVHLVLGSDVKSEKNGRRLRRSGSVEFKSPVVKKDGKRKSYNQTPKSGKKAKGKRTPLTPDVRDTTKAKMDIKKPLLMHPRTPNFLRRILKNKFGQVKKTTEELELEKINKLRKAMKGHLQQNTSYVKKALAANSYIPTRSATENTKTEEFHFETDSRIKQHPMNLRTDNTEKDFTEQLRKHPPSPKLKHKSTTTKVIPFSFQSDVNINKSASGEHSVKKWESMASAVTNFYCRTPDRCKSKQGSEQNDGPTKCQDNVKQKITLPKTPQLISRNRCRPITAQSQEQLEEKQLEEMKNYTFKAQEFNRRIIDADGMYGVKIQQRAPTTEAKPFQFQSNSKYGLRKQRGLATEEQKSKDEPVGSSKYKDSTSAMSSQLRPRSTDIKPFSFEERDKLLFAKKEDKIKKIIHEEEKAREFHARPLPYFSPELPEVTIKPVTDPQPFNLSINTNGAHMLSKWGEKIKREQQEQKDQMIFKALPSKVIYEEGFKPKPSTRPLTDISAFTMNTEQRSKLRDEYDTKRKEYEKIIEEEKKEKIKADEKEEQANIKVLRSQMVHVANPVRAFQTVELTGSDKPVTIPKTPNFETNKRLGRSMRV